MITKDAWAGIPVWTRDGKAAILKANIHPWNTPPYYADEFFLFTREGEIRQVTDLMDIFTEVLIGIFYDFSPDGNKVAFSLNTQPSSGNEYLFSILEVDSGDVTKYCWYAQSTYWSPDSEKLVLEIVEPGTQKLITVILNYKDGTAVKISDERGIRGWMVSP